MAVAQAITGTYEQGKESHFTGLVWLRHTPTITPPDGTTVATVCFAPGSRTHWHRHPGGQFLYVLAGRGRVRIRNEQGEMLEPGDVAYAGSKDWHFHGATRYAPMEHVAVHVGGGEPEWGEAVSDEEYDQGF